MLQTAAPVKDRLPDGQVQIKYETQWAIHWPFLADAVGWSIGEEQVAASFTSFGRTAPSADVEAKRNETVAFMRRANAESAATSKRRQQHRRT